MKLNKFGSSFFVKGWGKLSAKEKWLIALKDPAYLLIWFLLVVLFIAYIFIR